jgi:hypothetical protein
LSQSRKKHWLEYGIFFLLIATTAATSLAAWYTRQQWLTAEEVKKRSLRAYVGVSGPRMQCPDCGNPYYNQPQAGEMTNAADFLEFAVKASGVTPAYNVHIRHVDWEPIPANILYPFGAAYGEHKNVAQVIESRATLLPSESLPFQIVIKVSDFVGPKFGKYQLRIYGAIDYTDVFERDWTAEFCFVYGAVYGADIFTTAQSIMAITPACQNHKWQ